MKADILLDAIGMISDEYVQDAKSVRVVKKSHPWLKWSAMAACACVLVYLGLQSGFGGSFSQDAATNDGGNSMSAGTAQSNGSSGNASTDSAPSAEGATGSQESYMEDVNQSNYPYNDKLVLDFVGNVLPPMEMEAGTIVFNEITDMEQYRKLNNLATDGEVACYDTHNGLYQYVLEGVDTKHFLLTVEDGLLMDKEGSEAFMQACKEEESLAAVTDYLLWEEKLGTSAQGAISESMKTVALIMTPAKGINGQITVLASKDLAALGEEVQAFVEPMQDMLGTAQCSIVAGQETAVQYFYQHRRYKDEATEECYNYYVYLETKDMQYLYQFSTNWTLPGEAVTALHNPPHIISEALSQEESREMFAEILTGMIECLE